MRHIIWQYISIAYLLRKIEVEDYHAAKKWLQYMLGCAINDEYRSAQGL